MFQEQQYSGAQGQGQARGDQKRPTGKFEKVLQKVHLRIPPLRARSRLSIRSFSANLRHRAHLLHLEAEFRKALV